MSIKKIDAGKFHAKLSVTRVKNCNCKRNSDTTDTKSRNHAKYWHAQSLSAIGQNEDETNPSNYPRSRNREKYCMAKVDHPGKLARNNNLGSEKILENCDDQQNGNGVQDTVEEVGTPVDIFVPRHHSMPKNQQQRRTE